MPTRIDAIPDAAHSNGEVQQESPREQRQHTSKYGEESSFHTQEQGDDDNEDETLTGWSESRNADAEVPDQETAASANDTESSVAAPQEEEPGRDSLPPDTFEDYDGKIVDVEEYLETKWWKTEKILKKRTVRRKVQYLCKWEDTWETRRMYKALQTYKKYGYPAKKIDTRTDRNGDVRIKMILCQWEPGWEPAENVTQDLIRAFEEEQKEKAKQRRAHSRKKRS